MDVSNIIFWAIILAYVLFIYLIYTQNQLIKFNKQYILSLYKENKIYNTLFVLRWGLSCLKSGIPEMQGKHHIFKTYEAKRVQALREIVSLEKEIAEFEEQWNPIWNGGLEPSEAFTERALEILDSIDESLKFHEKQVEVLNDIIQQQDSSLPKITINKTAQHCISRAKNFIQ